MIFGPLVNAKDWVTIRFMSTLAQSFKPIVTALLLSVGISLPVWAQDAEVEPLFQQLAEATGEESPQIESQILDIWSKSGSAAIDLLVRRGQEALDAGDYAAAIEHFTAVVDHAPDFAEGYNGRATAYYFAGLIGPALDDIRQTLVLNPRHFGALRGFGAILEQLGQDEQALEVYGKVLALSPHAPDMEEAAERLEQKLLGRSL